MKEKIKKVGFYKDLKKMDKTINPFFNYDYFCMILAVIEDNPRLSKIKYKEKGGIPCPLCRVTSIYVKIPRIGVFSSRRFIWNQDLRHMISQHKVVPSNAFCREILTIFTDFRYWVRAAFPF